MGTARHAPNGTERAQGSAQARADLGDAGVTVTGYAYRWDTRRNTYNVVRVPSAYDNRVTRHLVCENPDGPRERTRVPWTDNVAQPRRSVRVFDAWDGTRRPHAWDVAIAKGTRRIVRVAPGNPSAQGYVAHTCPPEQREPRERREERRDGMPNVPHTCTRTHATAHAQRTCKAHAPSMDDVHAQAYAQTIARINARERLM